MKEMETVASQSSVITCEGNQTKRGSQCEEDASTDDPPSKKMKLFSFLYEEVTSCEAKSAKQEFDEYLQTVPTQEEINKGSLYFWKNNESRFSIMAKLYLSIPAPIERTFSTAGKILRQDRARLLPKNFERLLFLKVNSKFF